MFQAPQANGRTNDILGSSALLNESWGNILVNGVGFKWDAWARQGCNEEPTCVAFAR